MCDSMIVRYPAGGWLAQGTPVNWQREDQGKDFVIPWADAVQAPGSGHCIENGSDKPFPNGFGPSFAIVHIDTGVFGGHDFYIGHCSSLVSPGQAFDFGHPLAQANQGHNFEGTSGGWVELGEFANGRCGPSSRWFYDAVAQDLVLRAPDQPLKYGDQGLRVLQMSGWLRDCGWLPRRFWHFNRQVHGGLVAFQKHHHLNVLVGELNPRTEITLRQAAHWCRVHGRKEA